MRRFLSGAVLWLNCVLVVAVCMAQESASKRVSPTVASTDWPCWRGPNHDGIAPSDQSPPQKWSETENIVWKAAIPGRGHGSPTVIGGQVFLATAEHDREVQSVLCFDRKTGQLQWQTEVHKGGFSNKGNGKSSLASSTVACDGERVYINFLNNEAITTTALNRSGKILWQTKITDYILHQGFGSSPAIYGPLLLVSADNKGTGVIAALNRESGEFVWKQPRPKFPNYTSPIVLKVAGKDQLFFTGCELVSSFDPLTGHKNWEIEGSTTECVTSTVTDGNLIFTSGGYPDNHISAVAADGSGKVVWKNNTRVYVPSMLVRDGHLYTVLDAGVAMCWKAATGEEVWKGRINGTFSASPVMVGPLLYATSEAGKTYILKASPEGFDLIGENSLGSDVFATPTIVGSQIFMRVAAQQDGKRQESLYCIGDR
ncbi:MAG: PQQ-binding-like beta-propeller repeat protein [Planctomycetes bacterium]|nr:PQQ-binding-like beta-propeller repeat protein [Planctomycetota bacterium]